MNSAQLKYFLSAARHLSFSETAKEFYLTQPAISHQISELEQELGIKLFQRNARGVILTPAGHLFLEDAKRFLDLEIQSKSRLQSLSASGSCHLAIGYLANPSKQFLPQVVSNYRQKYPQVDIRLIRMNALSVQASMTQQEYDIYFSLLEDMANKSPYHVRKIHEDSYCLVCRSDHPCLQNFRIDYGKLATERFLMFAPDKAAFMTRQIYQVCKDLNFTPRIVQNYQSIEEVLFAAECGLGITILPYKIKDYVKASLSYVPLDSTHTACAFGAAWREQDDHPAVEWFIAELNQHLLQMGREGFTEKQQL